jgi:hypothetical protein
VNNPNKPFDVSMVVTLKYRVDRQVGALNEDEACVQSEEIVLHDLANGGFEFDDYGAPDIEVDCCTLGERDEYDRER